MLADSDDEPLMDNSSLIEKLFGTDLRIFNQFRNGQTSERMDKQFLFNLTYPTVLKPGERLFELHVFRFFSPPPVNLFSTYMKELALRPAFEVTSTASAMCFCHKPCNQNVESLRMNKERLHKNRVGVELATS